jgi:replicative DNA helicase
MQQNKVRDTYLETALPNMVEAENAILGAVLIDNSSMSQIVEIFQNKNPMYSPINKWIYKVMFNLFRQNKPIDPVIVGEELKKEGQLEKVGGVYAITQLSRGAVAHNLDYHCNLVLDKFYARKVLQICNATTSKILAGDEEPETVLNEHEHQLFEIRQEQSPVKTKPFAVLLAERRRYKEAIARGEQVEGLTKTKFENWDMLTGGLRKTNLIIVAGRPGMGKTSICLDIARNACLGDGQTVILVFSMEMSEEEIIDKLICGEALIDTTRFRDGKLSRDEQLRWEEAEQNIKDYKIIIDDRPNLSTVEMNAKALSVLKEEGRLDGIIADHIGKIKSDGTKNGNRNYEVGEITNNLKNMAKRLNVWLIALSQLSRAVEARNPPIPELADLRDSGNIEQDADQVFFVYREEYYAKEKSKEPGVSRIICAKNKSGSGGQFKLAFIKHAASFRNHALLR